MSTRRSLPILLTLALLFAQQAGQAHALSHLDLDSLKDGVSHTTLCAKCATFGQLSSFIPATASLTLDAPSAVSIHIIISCSSVHRTATAFQSRAPPCLA